MDASQVGLLLWTASVFLFGVCGNFLVLLAAYREKSLRKVPYLFVLNLCACHLMVLFVPYLIFVAALGCAQWKFSPAVCKCQAYLGYTLAMEVILTMTLISINRYVRIVQPVKYPFIFTQRSTALMIATSWILSLIGNIFPLTGYGTYGLNNSRDYMCALRVSSSVILIAVGGTCVIIAAVIIIACYVRVFFSIKAHNRRVRLTDFQRTTVTNTLSIFGGAPRESRGEEIQIAVTLFLFVVIFAICWSPTVVAVIINVITGEPTSPLSGILRINAVALETVLDPLVYAIRSKKFRQVIKKTFKRRSRHS